MEIIALADHQYRRGLRETFRPCGRALGPFGLPSQIIVIFDMTNLKLYGFNLAQAKNGLGASLGMVGMSQSSKVTRATEVGPDKPPNAELAS